VLPRQLFANRAFSMCVAAGVVLNFGAYGVLFIESIYLQTANHLSALAAGLVILPLTLAPTITTRLLDRFYPTLHFKPRLAIGYWFGIAGMGGVALSLLLPGLIATLVGLGLLGIALGYMTPAITTGVLASSTAGMSGRASGILNAARQIGGTLGVALMGTLIQWHLLRGMWQSCALGMGAFLVMSLVSARAMRA
jgi:DHA2 family methylenomycin A resistance protein-like MFS transporter